MKFRKVENIEDAMVKVLHDKNLSRGRGEGHTMALDYQPGNGTRYTIFFAELTNEQAHNFGYGDDCYLVTLQNGLDPKKFKSGVFYADGRPIFVIEVAETFELSSVNDACCITELIGHVLCAQTNADERAEAR